jgi:hypothetical protein
MADKKAQTGEKEVLKLLLGHKQIVSFSPFLGRDIKRR